MKTLILFFVVGSATLMLTSSQPEKQAAVPNRARNQTYCAPSFDPSKLDAANAPIFKGLGNLHYPITTRSAKAQPIEITRAA